MHIRKTTYRKIASKSSSHHSLTQRENASELDWIVANWTSFGESGEFISMSAIWASGKIAAARKDRDVSSMRFRESRIE